MTGRAPTWVAPLGSSVWGWLQSIRVPGHPGWCRWCAEGDVFVPGAHAGLAASAMAFKTVYQIGRMDSVGADERRAWVTYIRSFQVTWPPTRCGFFEDAALLRPIDAVLGRPDIAVRRAETRQACGALAGAGALPRWPILRLPWTATGVRRFLRGLAWSEDPWDAGSKASQLTAFVDTNRRLLGEVGHERRLADALLRELDSLQDADSGAWFRGSPPVSRRINGAMKVLTIYDLLRRRVPRPERLVDFCLAHVNEGDACHNVNIIYALHECAKWTDHRGTEIREYVASKLDVIRTHVKPDGGFSFYPGQSAIHYYRDVSMSRGLPVSDVQGTHLFVWALTLIGDMLGWGGELGWRGPVT